MTGKVWLVGAGPGDAGLLTLRGREVLSQADVVVYDALVGQGILTMIPEGARQGALLGLSFDPEHIPEVMTSVDGVVLGGNYARVAQTIHVEEAIRKYHGPVLIIHGDEDETVPVRYAVEAAEAYAHAKLVIIPGDTHCYDHHLDKVTDAIREWVMAGLR